MTYAAEGIGEALKSVLEMEAQGYTIRISDADGEEVSTAKIKALAALMGNAQRRSPTQSEPNNAPPPDGKS